MVYTTTVTSKGTITLPAHVRRDLKIKPGDRLTVDRKGDVITVKPDTYKEELAELRTQAQAHLKKRGLYGLSLEDIKKRADEAKLKEYVGKYGSRA